MLKKLFLLVVIIQSSCLASDSKISHKHLDLLDQSRNRSIPIEIYKNTESKTTDLPVIIINHGYTVQNTEYTFLAHALAKQGYLVVSIQHDLKNDAPLPKTGDLFEKRRPFWERGVQNILFTISELKKIEPHVKLDKVILIGHSNGGDMSMMFTEQHPELVSKVISLDSLRYPFPTKDHVPIFSIRANDTQADKGVLPESGASLIILKDTKHIDLCDRGSKETKEKIVDFITKFLNGNI